MTIECFIYLKKKLSIMKVIGIFKDKIIKMMYFQNFQIKKIKKKIKKIKKIILMIFLIVGQKVRQ